MATELGKAYVQIIPSARGIKSNIANELSGEVSSSGLALGKSLGAFMLKGLALLQIGKFFKDTINAGGSLEQSLGGVETLYKNSAKKVIDNAQKAYKTASMSANEYMQMSTSFAASLVSSTAGNTEKAAAIADMALIDMSDNANKMGSDMRSIQDAYQGFAKQQYQLLDNLKLGYGGTKGEMERLLADATKLSGVKYDINNLADVYNAIHVVQKELGITGTTALESAETLEGATNSMKAAWANFMSSLALNRETLAQDILALGDTMVAFAENVLRIVGNILKAMPTVIATVVTEGVPKIVAGVTNWLTQMGQAFVTNLPKIQQNISQMVTGMITWIEKDLPKFIQKGQEFITSIITGLTNYLPGILEKMASVVTSVVTTIGNKLPELVTKGSDMINSMINGLVNRSPSLFNNIGEMITKLLTIISQNMPKVLTKGIEIVTNLIQGITKTAPNLLAGLVQILTNLMKAITDRLPAWLQQGKNLLTNLLNGLIAKAPALINNIFNLVVNLVTTISKKMPDFVSQGVKMIVSLITGLGNMLPSLVTKVAQLIGTLIKTIAQRMPEWILKGSELGKSVLKGILQSIPSLVSGVTKLGVNLLKALWAALKGVVQIGKDLVSGLWSGISRMQDWVLDKIRGFGKTITNGIKYIFGIKSPSRVFRDEVGAMLGQGLAIGIEREVGTVASAMDEMEKATMRDMRSSIGFDTQVSSFMDSGFSGNDLHAKLQLGEHEYRLLVEDFSKEQAKQVGLQLAY